MTLYWPKKKVALDIVDEPGQKSFRGDEGEWTVIRATNEELEDYRVFESVMSYIAELIGTKLPSDDAWEKQSRMIYQRLFAQGA